MTIPEGTSLFWIPSCIYHKNTKLFYKLTKVVFSVNVDIKCIFACIHIFYECRYMVLQFKSRKKAI